MESDTFIDCNPQALEMFGCTRVQILNWSPLQFSPKKQPDWYSSKEKVLKKINAALNGNPQFFEWLHCKLDGTIFYTEVSLNRIKFNDGYFLQAIVRDISVRKKQEAFNRFINQISLTALKVTNMDEFYETIYKELNKIIEIPNFLIGLYQKKSYSISVVYMKDKKGCLKEYSLKSTCSEQVIQKNRPLIFYNEDMNQLEKEGKLQRIGSKAKVWLGVPLHIGKDLIGIVIAQSYSNKHNIDKSHLELLEYISNQIAILIKNKNKENEIRRLNQRNALILNSAGEGIIGMNIKGEHLFVNPAAASIFGYSQKELMSGQNCSLWCHTHICHKKRAKEKCPILSVADTKNPFTNRTEMFRKKNNECFQVEYTSAPFIEDTRVTGVVLVFKDISKQLELENQLSGIRRLISLSIKNCFKSIF